MKNDALPALPSLDAGAVAKVEAGIRQPPVLFSRTQPLLARLAERLGGPVIAYWNGSNTSVHPADAVALQHLLERVGRHDTLFIVIKSDGGCGETALRIIHQLRQHCRCLVALVPRECASAATMIAIGADRIEMGPAGYLTAVDVSLVHDLSPTNRAGGIAVSVDEVQRVVRLAHGTQGPGPGTVESAYHSLYEHLHPLVIGAAERAGSLSVSLCCELLACHLADEAKVQAIATALNGRYPSHSYPILVDEARRIGLDARRLAPDVSSLLLQLDACHSEMGQRAMTYFDAQHAHSREILSIWEASGTQIYYQEDRERFYRAEERRWITLNNQNGWRRVERIGRRNRRSALHVS